jgi:hypothetical protein
MPLHRLSAKEGAMAASNASVGVHTQSPPYQAYQILHQPEERRRRPAGADKFFHFLVNWDQYLSPLVTRLLPISGHTFMLGVGLIEIVAGLLVAFMPAIGGLVVGAWLCGIILNLLSIPGYYDVALRDLGLALGAFALSRLATEFDTRS